MSLEETKLRRFIWPPTKKRNPLFFPSSLQQFWGKGDGGGEERVGSRRPLVALEISLLTEVAAAAGDKLFGPTSERGNGGRWTANGDGDDDTTTCYKWVGFPPEFFPSSNRLLRFPSNLEIVSIFLLFIEFFVSVVGSSKIVHGSSFFVRGISVFSMPV